MKNLYVKLLEVQKELKAIEKTEINPFFKSRYFDVNAILSELKPLLSKNRLVLNQPFEVDGQGRNVLTTQIVDTESGEALRSSIYLPTVEDPQKMGSAITYFRRYALQSFLAMEAADDDGNAVSHSISKYDYTAKKDSLAKERKENAQNTVGVDSDFLS